LRLNAELTTLSACDTGVGKLQDRKALAIWWKRSSRWFTVGSSKPVERRRHLRSALMERFYQRMAQGEDTSSALRNAKLDLLAKYGDQVRPFIGQPS